METTEKERRNKNNKRKSRPETVIYCDEGVFALLRLAILPWIGKKTISCFAYLLLCEITIANLNKVIVEYSKFALAGFL